MQKFGMRTQWTIVILTLNFGCASQHKAFERTKAINTEEAYEHFLQKYPNSSMRSIALENLIAIKFKKAETANTRDSYQMFLSEYPDSEFSGRAQNALIMINFNLAEKYNCVLAYQEFIRKYPESEQSNIAKSKLKALNINGSAFRSIKIGEQIWMAENLNTNTFKFGEPITEAKNLRE